MDGSGYVVTFNNENGRNPVISQLHGNHNKLNTAFTTNNVEPSEPSIENTKEGHTAVNEKRTKKLKVSYAIGRWTNEEHHLFLEGLKLYGKEWKRVAMNVGTRSIMQTRTHAQKHFMKEIDCDMDCTKKKEKTFSMSTPAVIHEHSQATTDNGNQVSEVKPSLPVAEPQDVTNISRPSDAGTYSLGLSGKVPFVPTPIATISQGPSSGMYNFPPQPPPPQMNCSYPEYYYNNTFFPPYYHFGNNVPAGHFPHQLYHPHHPSGDSPAESEQQQQSYPAESPRLDTRPSPSDPYYSNHHHAHLQPNVTSATFPSRHHFAGDSNGTDVVGDDDNAEPSNTDTPSTYDIIFPVTGETVMKYRGNRDFVDLLKSNCCIYHTLTQTDQIRFAQNIVHYLLAVLKRRFFHIQRHHNIASGDGLQNQSSNSFHENSMYFFYPVQDATGYVSYELCLDAMKTAAWQFHPFWLLGDHRSPSASPHTSNSNDNPSTPSSFVYCDYKNCIQYPTSSPFVSYPTFVQLSQYETRNILQNEGPKDLLIIPTNLLTSSLKTATSHHSDRSNSVLHHDRVDPVSHHNKNTSIHGDGSSSYNNDSSHHHHPIYDRTHW